jgi:hypothetical protein
MDNKITKEILVNLDVEELTQVMIAYFLDDDLSDNFKTAFQKLAPDYYADIESASSNPNCSCINKLKLFIKANKDSFATLLLSFADNFSSQEDLYDKVTNKAKNVAQLYLGGSVLKTTVSAWKDFFNKISKAQYRSFSVVKEGEDLLVFFL